MALEEVGGAQRRRVEAAKEEVGGAQRRRVEAAKEVFEVHRFMRIDGLD